MQRVRKAIIPAAGLGTRFLPATKAVPKEMLPIVDVPTIQLVVEEALAAGIEEVILVTGRGKVAIEDHFDVSFELERTLRDRGKQELLELVEKVSKLTRLTVVRQKEPLGLGHAVSVARRAAGDEPVAVLLGDDLFFSEGRPAIGQLMDAYHDGEQAAVIALLEVPPGEEHKYGVVGGDLLPSGRMQCHELVEKPAPGTAPSRLAIVGRYVLPPAIWDILATTPPGKGGEIQLTDALRALAPSGHVIGMTVDAVRHDAGDKLGFLGATLSYALTRPELRDGTVELMKRLLAESAARRAA
ncbi:MAG: UTP--glucose-1-phosphate uridylyltransferase [Kofleriaceae bacterium]